MNNKLIPDPVDEVADKFNEYFSTIAENRQSNIYNIGTDFHQYLKGRNDNNVYTTYQSVSDKNIKVEHRY